ncbi:FtsK/SpoIIIE domain-containing protein [Terrabacter sp. NPDC000476]|uniref:FtsK/SpoIIIE domain-containing protein n=1 Tax=Terrabacter sp. NPDC000476 TaxID=3154258 RepID=UPI00332689A9
MRIPLTVVDLHAGGPPRDLLVDAPPGTPFGRIRAEIATAAGCDGAHLTCDGRPVGDDAELGRPPLLRGAVLTTGDGAGGASLFGAVELRITGGFGAGRTMRLGRGQHLIGRAAGASVRLDDPAVSRAHAHLDVRADGIRLRDLQPTNRSTVDGLPVPTGGIRLEDGQHVVVGSTSLTLGRPRLAVARHEVRDGVVQVHRPPRFVDTSPPPSVHVPEEPQRPEPGRMPVLASVAPLLVSAALAVALASPALLLFALLSPVLLIGQWWSDRRAGRTSHRRRLQAHSAALAHAEQALLSAARDDTAVRRDAHPDLGVVAAVASTRATRLWERRPGDADHLVVRVGCADQPARTGVTGCVPDVVPLADDAPVLVDLTAAGVTGIHGARAAGASLVGGLVVQIASWHSPRHLTIELLTAARSPGGAWEWLGLLPHATLRDGTSTRVALGPREVGERVAELRALAVLRREAAAGLDGPRTRHPADTVVLVDGPDALRTVRGFAELLTEGPAAGIVFVCLGDDAQALPAETRVTVEVDARDGSATRRDDSGTLTGIRADLPTPGWLETTARALAPLVDATPEPGQASLPDEVSFVDLHRRVGPDPTDARQVAEAWERGDGRPRALLGVGPAGPFHVDLAADGPHALVGGTTGSGKSELLQALVAGLAVTNRPDQLSLLLVDYKGGSAFGACARLPHTVGLVTDLDGHLTSRALTSLDAEMKRREQLLARAGAKDLEDYRPRASVCVDLPTLPRLVIVLDEFKALADEFPDFIAGLVRVAALGRSLGLHLVLATQRPSGVVSGDMRANVALRIALRVRDRSDSTDVIDAADAAALEPRTPGRACVRTGDHELTTVQTAFLGGPAARHAARQAVTVHVLDPGRRRPTTTAVPLQPRSTELDAVVSALQEAATRLHIPGAAPPWLPPLPRELCAADLSVPQRDPNIGKVSARLGTGPVLALGLVDVPVQQRQDVLVWELQDGGHLGIAGGSRSGRTTALATVAHGLAVATSPGDVHLHVLTGSPPPEGLRDALEGLPHVGTVTGPDDLAVTRRLLRRLVGMLEAGAPPASHTVVLVDGWEPLEEALATVEHGAPLDDLHRLVRDGPSVGLRFAVTGGRAILSGRLPGLLRRRLALHLPDPLDLALAGIAAEAAGTPRPPGRAIDVGSGLEVQLAVPGDDASLPATLIALNALTGLNALTSPTDGAGPGDVVSARSAAPPWRLRPLPGEVGLGVLPSDDELLVVGLGGDECRPVGVPLGSGYRRALVAGPPRSGRSNTLRCLAIRLLERGRTVVVVAPRRTDSAAWTTSSTVLVLGASDREQLVGTLRREPHACLLVDDVELLEGSEVEAVLVEAVGIVDDSDGLVVVAGELDRASAAYRGLVPAVARDGLGIVLGATAASDGDVLGARLELPQERRPGRGFLVRGGHAEPIQVARADR